MAFLIDMCVAVSGFVDGSLFTKLRTEILAHQVPYNICVMGKNGSGKSSWINTLNTALQDQKKAVLAPDVVVQFGGGAQVFACLC